MDEKNIEGKNQIDGCPPEQQILGEWKTVSALLETLHPVKRPTIDQIIQCWTFVEVLTHGMGGLVFLSSIYLKI